MPTPRVVAAVVLVCLPAVSPAGEKLRYNRDVRPILAENCFACHGPDSAARKAGLRLDQRDAAMKATAIVPGKPADSEIIDRIFRDDGDELLMPSAKSHKKLTPAQKETLKRWVAEGAEYEPHWSFIPPTRPAVPAVKDAKWVRNPIDAFVLAALEKRGLAPAKEADRRTLARRLSLDIIGLPPEPADVAAFVADKSPDAYERYVDKLMASPHYGEHRGRYWLDAARYGDTHGIHFDNYREMWSYRDWVINALNQNMPFDRFTVEQLAGDLLPNPTLDQLVATGFNRCNITTNEGGAINEEYLVLYARDRTETTAAVWLGLTAGCAVCHDHKYDPVSQKDFYALSAFFNNTTQNAMDGNIHNTPPVIPVPKAADRARFEQLTKDLAAARQALDARKAAARPAFDRWLKGVSPAAIAKMDPTDGLTFHAPLGEGGGRDLAFAVNGKVQRRAEANGFGWVVKKGDGKAFTVQPGAALTFPEVGDFDTKQAFAVSAWVALSKRGATGSVVARMDPANGHRGWDLWVQNDRIGMHVISKWQDDAVKVVAKTPFTPNRWHHVVATYDGSGKAAGVKLYVDGEPQPFDTETDTLTGSIQTAVPFAIGQRGNGGERANGVGVQDVRVYGRALSAGDAKQLATASKAADLLAKPKRSAAETEELFAFWLTAEDKEYQQKQKAVAAIQQEEVAIRGRGTIAHVMNEKPSEPTAYVLFRGDYDKRRDQVKAVTPAALPPLPPDLPRNRLGLAKWLLQKDHPLTARVTVNRYWQELFGTGLVRTSGDFGITGELPSHPELLDWLAVEYREKGWDTKAFFKLLVTSATYRQAAVATPEKIEKDRDNRLLSRGPRFRMDAEMVRDYALAASGLLRPTIGGPSVKPYQPTGVWEAVAMIGSNTRDYKRDNGDNLYRRSMYTFWKRAAPPAAMEVLNAPNRETCATRRERTNTPLQALLTMNDIQFVEAARVLAEATMKSADTDAARLEFVSQKLLARSLTPAETAIVSETLANLRGEFTAKPEEAKKLIAFGESKADAALPATELAAWTMVANQLLNLDEVLNK